MRRAASSSTFCRVPQHRQECLCHIAAQTLLSVPTAWQDRSRKALDDHRDALSAADACRGEAVLFLAAAQLVEQRDHEARSRRGQRMAEGDRAAVDVEFV